jgi:hypothetical protein
MEDNMIDLKYVTYCGLYCGLCSSRNRIPHQASALWQAMKKEGYDLWGKEVYANFQEFWDFLTNLTNYKYICPGCRQGGGPPFCGIRKCAIEKNIEVCALCDDFPCDKISEIAKGYITLIPDGLRIKEKGLETWIKEQEDRAKTGFCYVDIRCEPYKIPE